jgi:hypothetical protein
MGFSPRSAAELERGGGEHDRDDDEQDLKPAAHRVSGQRIVPRFVSSKNR